MLLFRMLWWALLIHNQNYCDNLHSGFTAELFRLKSNWHLHICWIQRFGISECQDVWLTKPTTRMAPCISSCCGLPLQKAVMLIGVAELVCASCHIQWWGSQWYCLYFSESMSTYHTYSIKDKHFSLQVITIIATALNVTKVSQFSLKNV